MNNKTTYGLSVAALIGVLMTVGTWLHLKALNDTRGLMDERELRPIATLLRENRVIVQELSLETSQKRDSGILESYLIKIRQDGVARHAGTKQRLDQLVENNTAIVTLIKAYAPHAKTLAFTTESDKFRNYASASRDRWNSVMEIFMAGGNYPVAEIPFPAGFPAATDAEIAATH